MKIKFDKYHGTGNDFIIINAYDNAQIFDTKQIKQLCDRRFGIGADGLMLLKKHNSCDFLMEYYNADGNLGTMCGNGGRCITAFAKKQGLITTEAKFMASDGVHHSFIDENNIVKLKMTDIDEVEQINNCMFLDSGSPHYIEFVEDVAAVNVYERGKKIRYSSRFSGGTNVNFVAANSDGIDIRTYERGVENETLSCGTGSVASAVAFYTKNKLANNKIPKSLKINTRGGHLEVSFNEKDGKFTDIFLTGAATFVFSGEICINTLLN